MALTKLAPETPVSRIAARYPAALRMMEALGIDFCCGGKRPLAEAAAAAGVSVATALAVLQAAILQSAESQEAGRDWEGAPLDDLIAHIVETHHAYLHAELPRLEGVLALVGRVHGPNHGAVLVPLAARFAALRAELEGHLEKEERIAFPAISRLAAGDQGVQADSVVAELADEHDSAGEALAAMRQITDGYAVPDDVCATYQGLYESLQALERDIHRHIHLENNILFPRALRLAHGE